LPVKGIAPGRLFKSERVSIEVTDCEGISGKNIVATSAESKSPV
jgi:hypothetical protein